MEIQKDNLNVLNLNKKINPDIKICFFQAAEIAGSCRKFKCLSCRTCQQAQAQAYCAELGQTDLQPYKLHSLQLQTEQDMCPGQSYLTKACSDRAAVPCCSPCCSCAKILMKGSLESRSISCIYAILSVHKLKFAPSKARL